MMESSRVIHGFTHIRRTIADAISLSLQVSTPEPAVANQAIGIDVVVQLDDLDGSESISSYVIEGVPAGATLSAGTLEAMVLYSRS